jgi:hypothetical protein
MRYAQTKCVRMRDKPGKRSRRINEKGRNVLLDREGATFDPEEWLVILGDLFGGVFVVNVLCCLLHQLQLFAFRASSWGLRFFVVE